MSKQSKYNPKTIQNKSKTFKNCGKHHQQRSRSGSSSNNGRSVRMGVPQRSRRSAAKRTPPSPAISSPRTTASLPPPMDKALRAAPGPAPLGDIGKKTTGPAKRIRRNLETVWYVLIVSYVSLFDVWCLIVGINHSERLRSDVVHLWECLGGFWYDCATPAVQILSHASCPWYLEALSEIKHMTSVEQRRAVSHAMQWAWTNKRMACIIMHLL